MFAHWSLLRLLLFYFMSIGKNKVFSFYNLPIGSAVFRVSSTIIFMKKITTAIQCSTKGPAGHSRMCLY